MDSTIMGLSTPHLARGQGRVACEALALPLTLSEMWNNVPLWVVNTVVFKTHNRLQTSEITLIQSIA